MSASPVPETDYLQPDFDANTLTMPKLRGILLAHDIEYPSNAKKSQLVDLFDHEVAPQAKRILAMRSRTKRSTRGIIDMPSSAEHSLDGDHSDQDTKPARTPRAKRSAHSSVAREPEDSLPSRASVARSSRASSARYSVASDAPSDSTTRRSSAGARRTRKSTVTPSLKEESDDDLPPWNREGSQTTGFSSENVFQRGSSPLLNGGYSGDETRRRTTGAVTSSDRKRSSGASRRKTDSSAVEEKSTQKSASSAARRGRPSGSRNVSSRVQPELQADEDDEDEEFEEDEDVEDTIVPGEEFTPQEQHSLALAQRDGAITITSHRRPKASSRSAIARIAPWAIVLGLVTGLGTVWRQEKIAVGFCGVGRPSDSLAGLEIPDWARDVVQPQCEPCPPHAYCYTDLQASCEEDFILVPHPLSLGGIVPLPPTCEPDGEKARKVKAVADRAVEELRERNAQFECGQLLDEDGKHAKSPEIKEESLKAQVSSNRRKGMSQEEFEDLWHSALGELVDRDEIVSDVDSTDTNSHRHLRSTSLARIPLACAVRRSIRLALARHLGKLLAGLGLVLLSLYAYTTLVSSREMEARAKQLAGAALERLTQQALWAYDDDQDGEDAYIGVTQLRDDVLRDEFSASRRRALWERVQKKVEDNTNVRSMVREDPRSGEVGRVWQWIGAVGVLSDDGEGSTGRRNRRKSSHRVSFGPVPGGSSAISTPTPAHTHETGQLKPWDEGRPIY